MKATTAKKRWQAAFRATRILYARGVDWFDCGVVAHIPAQPQYPGARRDRPVVWRFGAARSLTGSCWTSEDDVRDHKRSVLMWLRQGLTLTQADTSGLICGPIARLP